VIAVGLRPAIVGLAIVAAGIACFVPTATRNRLVFSSTPNPPPLFEATQLKIRKGETACTRGVVLDDDAARMRVIVGSFGRPPVPIDLILSGPGYRFHRVLRDYPPVATAVQMEIPQPLRTLTAELCLANRGPRTFALGATAESRTKSRTVTYVGGEPIIGDPTIQLFERERRSLAALLPTMIRRAAFFKPGVVGPWTFWVLGALLLLVLPLGSMAALAVEPRERHAESAQVKGDEQREEHTRIPAPGATRQDPTGSGQAHRDQ
jgi:hypothetical protein